MVLGRVKDEAGVCGSDGSFLLPLPTDVHLDVRPDHRRVRVKRGADGSLAIVAVLEQQMSSAMLSITEADGWMCLPAMKEEGRHTMRKGEMVRVRLFRGGGVGWLCIE